MLQQTAAGSSGSRGNRHSQGALQSVSAAGNRAESNAVLCFDIARQYSFMIDEVELTICKTVSKGAYVCKQEHPLLSSRSLVPCALRNW